MLCGTGLLLISTLVSKTKTSATECETTFSGLKEDEALKISGCCTGIIDRAYESGHDYEEEHGGCCRCTVAALQSALDFLPDSRELFRAASCLDGGATPTGLQNCGAFTGAGMFIGWICGIERFRNTRLSHKLIRQVFHRFQDAYGGVLCKDVRKSLGGDCPEAVGRASKWTIEAILHQFAGYERK